jgi:hypothetical protein
MAYPSDVIEIPATRLFQRAPDFAQTVKAGRINDTWTDRVDSNLALFQAERPAARKGTGRRLYEIADTTGFSRVVLQL